LPRSDTGRPKRYSVDPFPSHLGGDEALAEQLTGGVKRARPGIRQTFSAIQRPKNSFGLTHH
jgi:hypothetical protein